MFDQCPRSLNAVIHLNTTCWLELHTLPALFHHPQPAKDKNVTPQQTKTTITHKLRVQCKQANTDIVLLYFVIANRSISHLAHIHSQQLSLCLSLLVFIQFYFYFLRFFRVEYRHFEQQSTTRNFIRKNSKKTKKCIFQQSKCSRHKPKKD